jgi:hypothetical protein
MKMEPIPGPDRQPEDVFANLWDGLSTIARFNLTFAVVLLGSAIATRSVGLAAASLAVFEEGAIHALFMGALRLRPIGRARLTTVLICLQLAPAFALLWCICLDLVAPAVPPSHWIALLGSLSLVICVINAGVTARFRGARKGQLAAMWPSLRANAPIGAALILIAIARPHLAWADKALGLILAGSRLGASQMMIGLGRFPLQESIWTAGSVRQLIEEHPRLAILRSWVWQEAAALPWSIRRVNPFSEVRRPGGLL